MSESKSTTSQKLSGSALDIEFQKTADRVIKSKPSKDNEPSTDQKLAIYAAYKQATMGDNSTSQPWQIDFVNFAKWDAWIKLKGMKASDAKRLYIKLCAVHFG